jgi:glutamate 5-kinase
LVEHTHFNDNVKCNHIINFLTRASHQGAIPIINYNDPVSFEENRNVELSMLSSQNERIVECIDNDETASIIAEIVGAPLLLILTSVEGIYKDANDKDTLIEEIMARDAESLSRKIDETISFCNGTSRHGSGGAAAKLKYIKAAAAKGTQVVIGHARHGINDLVNGKVKCTRIGLK